MLQKKKNIIGIFSIIVGICGSAGWWLIVQREKHTEVSAETLTVVTTLYPLTYMAQNVGGTEVTVRSVVPAGTEPHEYEPTARDVVSMYQADIFVLNGGGIDAWAEKLRLELEQRGVTVIQMSDFINMQVDASFGTPDPHFWLDPTLMRNAVSIIGTAFINRDPLRADKYTENMMRLDTQLSALDETYQAGLQRCALRTFVTSHDAFRFLARRYHLEALSVNGMSPDAEASQRTLADLTVIVRERSIPVVFFETLASPKVAETLAREANVMTAVLNPIEGLTEAERTAGQDYSTLMHNNLLSLQSALRCQ